MTRHKPIAASWVVFGVFGYLMKKFEYESAPLVFALVLCPILENAFRQSLMMSYGDLTIFFTRPISLTFMITGIVLFALPVLLRYGRRCGTGFRLTSNDGRRRSVGGFTPFLSREPDG